MAQREREIPEHAVHTVAEQAVKADELVWSRCALGVWARSVTGGLGASGARAARRAGGLGRTSDDRGDDRTLRAVLVGLLREAER
jgi:hypothetical protein